MMDGACICSDGEDEWDLSGLEGDHTTTGPCSGVFCDGQWNYHFNICENVSPPAPPRAPPPH